MINGSILAPFRHDSTWPDDVLKQFRSSVYYRFVHVPGRDYTYMLRALAEEKQESKSPSDAGGPWSYIKGICDKVAHLKIGVVDDQEMINLANNILVFTNILLIDRYGLRKRLRVVVGSVSEASREAARKAFKASIDDAYDSLKDSIDALTSNNRSAKFRNAGPIDLEDAQVLSTIPSTHPLVEQQDRSHKRTLTLRIDNSGTDICEYEFYPHDPIGWIMVGGRPSNDRFADDGMASTGPFAPAGE